MSIARPCSSEKPQTGLTGGRPPSAGAALTLTGEQIISTHPQHPTGASPSQLHLPPARRRWLIALLLSLTLFQAGAALRALQRPPELAGLVVLPPALEMVAAVLWALCFAAALIALVRRSTHALRYNGWLLSAFVLYSAARLALYTRADYDMQRLPLLLALAGGLIVIMFIVFRARTQ